MSDRLDALERDWVSETSNKEPEISKVLTPEERKETIRLLAQLMRGLGPLVEAGVINVDSLLSGFVQEVETWRRENPESIDKILELSVYERE